MRDGYGTGMHFDRDALRADAIATAEMFGVTVTDEQVEAYIDHQIAARTAMAARHAEEYANRGGRTPVPTWLKYEPYKDRQGKPFGRRYFTEDGYEALPGLGRLGVGSRPSRWYVTGPDNFESVVTTIAEMIGTIEYGRARNSA